MNLKPKRLLQLFVLTALIFSPIGNSGYVRAGTAAIYQAVPSVTTSVNPTSVNFGGTALVSVSLNNVPGSGYTSAEFTCTYDANLLEASNIAVTNLFGADAVTAISGPQNGKFIFAIAGSKSHKATTSGTAFTFNVKGLYVGTTVIECTARVSKGDNMLSPLPSIGTSFSVNGGVPSPEPFTPTAIPTSACDKAQFIADITVPSGTVMLPGATFVKTWRLTNVGTCTWTTSYQLIFYSGVNMGPSTPISLPVSVQVGNTVDISINMTAPFWAGSQRGYWMFKNANGALFGIGPNANEPWFVDINVTGPTVTFFAPTNSPTPTSMLGAPTHSPTPSVTPGGPTPTYEVKYDFVSNACAANWYNGVSQLPCHGIDGDSNGFVLVQSAPKLENGNISTRPGLLAFPQNINNGYIQGFYPAIKVQPGSRFRSTIGCEFEATDCYVVFRLDYVISGSINIRTFWAFVEKYDGQPYTADIDLSPLAGQDVRFILTILSAGPTTGDRTMWVDPILYQTLPDISPTLSSIPTLTATLTNIPTNTITTTPTDGPGTISIIGKAMASKPVTISLYNTDNSLFTSMPVVDADGNFVFTIGAGTYSIGAKADGFLSARSSFTLDSGDIRLTITLLAGDIDNNNVIDQFDALTIGINYNSPFPTAADLNNDGTINLLDLELLALNYHKIGPIVWQ